MCWSSEHDASVIVCANTTYATVCDLSYDALEVVIAASERHRNETPARLLARKDELLALLARWDDGVAAAILTPNVLLDTPKEVVLRKSAPLLSRLAAAQFVYLDGSSACFEEHRERLLTISLEPFEPCRIQEIEFSRN
jgi:hypothetical protein